MSFLCISGPFMQLLESKMSESAPISQLSPFRMKLAKIIFFCSSGRFIWFKQNFFGKFEAPRGFVKHPVLYNRFV